MRHRPHIRYGICLALMFGALLSAMPARALDLNDFRRAHHLPQLNMSSALALAAEQHARDLARRNHLDHRGFRRRLSTIASTAAENVLVGCPDEACAIRVWARSRGHRRNMLMRGVSAYGIASATAANGRRYWVLELGN